MSIEARNMVLEAELRVMHPYYRKALNDLIDACMDGDKLKAPDRKSIINARKCLTRDYKHTLVREA
jgi:hypothetical protein